MAINHMASNNFAVLEHFVICHRSQNFYPMILGVRFGVWSSIRTFFVMINVAIYCTDSHPSAAYTPQPSFTVIQKVERIEDELSDSRRLLELYVFATGRSSEAEATRLFAKNFNKQIHLDRIKIRGDVVFIDGGSQSAFRIRLSRYDFGMLFTVFLSGTDLERMLKVGVFLLRYVLSMLDATIHILVNPFSISPEMSLFRSNLIATLKVSCIGQLEYFEDIEAVPGLTQTSLRTILSLYAGICDKLVFLGEATYSTDEQDDSLIVYNGHVLNSPHSFTVLLLLVRLCKITELNLRTCMLFVPLHIEAQNILSKCQITRLVPPVSEFSCSCLFLAPDSDLIIQSRIWHSLAEVSWLSRRGDWLHGFKFASILTMPETRFCRHLVRPAIRPDDFSTLDLLTVLGDFPPHCISYIEKATKLRGLCISHCYSIPPLDFLKNLPSLEALCLEHNNLNSLPGHILSGLSKLRAMSVSGTLILELPQEIGQLKDLRKLFLASNPFLTAIPETLSNCPRLSFLSCYSNNLRSLPNRLDNLEYFNMSFSRHPELLLATVTNYTKLQILDATDHPISTLPDDFANLTNLRSLNLSSNRLSELPPVVARLPILSILLLSNNQLSALPDTFSNLQYLDILLLTGNKFRRIPRLLKNMKEGGHFSLLHIAGNPLLNSDTDSQLGLRTLWRVFGDCTMLEGEYQQRIHQNEKVEFYNEHNSRPLHWNLEMLRQLRLLEPPHSELLEAGLKNAWTKVLRSPALGKNHRLVNRKRMNDLIKVLYDPTLDKLGAYVISESNKAVIRDYLGAITLNLQERMKRLDIDHAIAMLMQWNDSLGNCPSGQAGALAEIYRIHCLDLDPDNFETFVKAFIAKEKEDRFTGVVALPNHPQNVHLVAYWKRWFKDELGLVLEFEDPYGRIGEDRFGNNPTAVLKGFFDSFSPKNIIDALTANINGSGQVGPAWLYLIGAEEVSIEEGEAFFVVEKRKNTASYGFPHVIKEAGAEEILARMNILERRAVGVLRSTRKRPHQDILRPI